MKQKWYRAYILKRFMTSSEQKQFDRLYESNKIRILGQREAKRRVK